LAIWLAIATGISLFSPNICHTFSRTVAEEFFEPFVIATTDGSAIAVDSPKRVLSGERTFAVAALAPPPGHQTTTVLRR
jgi:hypothetical protein